MRYWVFVAWVNSYLIALCNAIGLLLLFYSGSARSYVVQWKLTEIFGKHGHTMVWDAPVNYEQVPLYLRNQIKKWEASTNGWSIPTGDYSKEIGRHLTMGTFVHVMRVEGAIPNGSILAIFLFEQPASIRRGGTYTVDLNNRPVRIPEHQHRSVTYRQTYMLGVWGELTAFPLERYFPFDELRSREVWVPRARRSLCFWGGSIGLCSLCLGAAAAVFSERGRLRQRLRSAIPRSKEAFTRFETMVRNTWQKQGHTTQIVARDNADPQGTADDDRTDPVFILCLLHICRQAQEEEVRNELKRLRDRQAEIRADIEQIHRAVKGKTAENIKMLLGQFPSSKRVRIAKAENLLAQARRLYEHDMATDTPSALMPENEGTLLPRLEDQPITDDALDRMIYELFVDTYPYIHAAGGDPIVTSAILLSFVRPKTRTSFVGGSYASFEIIRSSTMGKSAETLRLFGKRILPEDIEHNWMILQKGGVIISHRRTGSGHGKLSFSLNDKEESARVPWNEVIRIINRARSELLALRA